MEKIAKKEKEQGEKVFLTIFGCALGGFLTPLSIIILIGLELIEWSSRLATTCFGTMSFFGLLLLIASISIWETRKEVK